MSAFLGTLTERCGVIQFKEPCKERLVYTKTDLVSWLLVCRENVQNKYVEVKKCNALT